LRNAEERFLSLVCRLPGGALVYVAHPYRQLRFDNISHQFQAPGSVKHCSPEFGLSTKYTRADGGVTQQQESDRRQLECDLEQAMSDLKATNDPGRRRGLLRKMRRLIAEFDRLLFESTE
jgi:hypothetical protein